MLKKIVDLFRRSNVSTGNLTETSDFWYTIDGFNVSTSGANVTKQSAMRQWTVYACISIISETLAQLPLKLKRPDGKGGTEDATDHPVYTICKTLPNSRMTSFNWREAQQANLLTTGNCYNFIERGKWWTKAIWPIDPTTVIVRFASGKEAAQMRLNKNDRVVYEVQTVDGPKVYKSADILHISGFGWNGLKGESIITNFAKESIGNAIALDVFQGAAMRNGVTPGGVLEHPDTLGDSKEAFIAALESRYSGQNNARRPMILEDGMKFNKVDVSLVDKQLIEQMKMSANQICGVFKIPPHKVGIFEKNTNYNNTEQGNRAFLDGTMQQWVVRWEQALNWKLLTEYERKEGYFFKFNFDALLRPDAKTRSELEWREWQMGTPLNEIRKRNDLNPLDGQDVSYVPVNMVPYHLAGQKAAMAQEGEDPGVETIDEEVKRLKKYEVNAVSRLIAKEKKGSVEDFEEETNELYRKVFSIINEQLMPNIYFVHDEFRGAEIVRQMKEEFEGNKARLIAMQKNNWAENGKGNESS